MWNLICVKPNTWSKYEDVDLYAPGDVGSCSSFEEVRAGQDRSIKILMVSVRFSLFDLHHTEQFLPSQS